MAWCWRAAAGALRVGSALRGQPWAPPRQPWTRQCQRHIVVGPMPFDTYALVVRLENEGFTRPQAQAITNTLLGCNFAFLAALAVPCHRARNGSAAPRYSNGLHCLSAASALC